MEEKPLYFRVATRPAKVLYEVVTWVCRVVMPSLGGARSNNEITTYLLLYCSTHFTRLSIMVNQNW